MVDLKVKLHDLEFKNPVTLASGTCGFAREMSEFFDPELMGGYFLKGTTLKNRDGNNYPRMAETPSGMLNAVGLQNKGIDYFYIHLCPQFQMLKRQKTIRIECRTLYKICPQDSVSDRSEYIFPKR